MNELDRLKKLQVYMQNESLDLAIVDDPVNLRYMTGLQLSAGRLLVTKQEAVLFVDGRYTEICKKNSTYHVLPSDDASIVSWLTAAERPPLLAIGFDSSTTTYKGYEELKKIVQKVSESKKLEEPILLQPVNGLLNSLRMIKDSYEIDTLKKAAKLGSEGYDHVQRLLREGITESELARELEIYWLKMGGDGLAFEPIIAFGANSSMPHYRSGEAALKSGDTVLIDIGVKYEGYHSDMTRTVFFGEPPEKMIEIYEVVREAQEKALELCRPGVEIHELDKAARGYIALKGYGSQFSHRLGHGVGLEIHEAPSLGQTGPDATLKLAEGMVITIEPGIYIPDLGGVRIEDTILITNDAYENLTLRPKELIHMGEHHDKHQRN